MVFLLLYQALKSNQLHYLKNIYRVLLQLQFLCIVLELFIVSLSVTNHPPYVLPNKTRLPAATINGQLRTRLQNLPATQGLGLEATSADRS